MASKASSVRAFMGSVEGLCLIESVLRNSLNTYRRYADNRCSFGDDADQAAAFMDLTRLYISVSDACDRKLKANLSAQSEFQDLTQKLESGMTEAEILETMEAHFERRGWGSLDACRSMLFTYLTEEGLSRDQAEEVVRNGLPQRAAVTRQLPLTHKLRKANERMEQHLEDANERLAIALEPHDASGGTGGDHGLETPGTAEGPSTDDSGGQGGTGE